MTVYAKDWSAAIVDVFEDFLDSKGITIPNDEKEGIEGEAILYGSDWDSLVFEVSKHVEKLSKELGADVNLEDWEH